VVGVGAAWGGDALVELARGAHLLVHEAHFAESVEMAIQAGALEPERLRREAALRTPLDEAGARAARAGAGGLALVRLRPPPLFALQASRAVGEYRGSVFVPEDGEELELRS
jgi:ribonuclease BN (tRNA processing enzyme)